jgi:predicted adenylyl cyclase CyaB
MAALTETLGVRARVTKRRALYLWRGVRIHLDEVEELGDFIEFEAPVANDAETDTATGYVQELREAFGIGEGDLVESSYCELALALCGQIPARPASSFFPRDVDR